MLRCDGMAHRVASNTASQNLLIVTKFSSTLIWAFSMYFVLLELGDTAINNANVFCYDQTSPNQANIGAQRFFNCLLNDTDTSNSIWSYNHTDASYDQSMGDTVRGDNNMKGGSRLKDVFAVDHSCATYEVVYVTHVLSGFAIRSLQTVLTVEVVIGLICLVRFLQDDSKHTIYQLIELAMDCMVLMFGSQAYISIKSTEAINNDLEAMSDCDWASDGLNWIVEDSSETGAIEVVIMLVMCAEAGELIDKLTSLVDEHCRPKPLRKVKPDIINRSLSWSVITNS